MTEGHHLPSTPYHLLLSPPPHLLFCFVVFGFGGVKTENFKTGYKMGILLLLLKENV